MTSCRLALLTFTMALLAGCNTTGGTIGGLIPAPKFLKGDISGTTYTAPDKSFSFLTPINPATKEYPYVQIKEEFFAEGAYISFSSELSSRIYRFSILRRDSASKDWKFEDISARAIEKFRAQLAQGYGSNAEVVESTPEVINGQRAVHWKLSQGVNPATSGSPDSPFTIQQDGYTIDLEKGVAMVFVQTTARDNPWAMSRALAESIVMR